MEARTGLRSGLFGCREALMRREKMSHRAGETPIVSILAIMIPTISDKKKRAMKAFMP